MSNEFEGADRLPPQNIEAEEAILGGILIDPEAIGRIIDVLRPEMFYVGAHQEIFRACVMLHSQSNPTDMMSITTWLSDRELLEKVGGQSKIVQLCDRTVSAINVDYYAQLVVEKFTRRKLAEAGRETVNLSYDTGIELTQALDLAEQKIFGVTQARTQQGLTPAGDILTKTFYELENRFNSLGSTGMNLPGLATGFYDLDAMTQGFQRSDLIIIAGRPSMGKTAFSLGVAHKMANIHRLPVAIFSLEMSKEQLVYRLLSTVSCMKQISRSPIDSSRLRSGQIGENEWSSIASAISHLSEIPIYIDDAPNPSITELRSKARRLQSEKGGSLGLILIDYLQLMEGSGSDNRVQELSRITRSLKGLARELSVPVVALSQLSRGVEARTNKRPMLSDLRESGCVSGDTLVTMADSGTQVPIKDLVGKSGFAVWALNETTMKLERAIASRAFSTGVKPVYQLTTRLGRTIRATANHKFFTVRGWKRLDELSEGEYLALPRYLLSSSLQLMSDAELALLGHLIGDGCTLPHHAIQYTTREADLADLVLNLAIEVFGDRVAPRIKKERDWYQVYLSASYRPTHGVKNPVAKWLENLGVFGLRSHEKFVPTQVFEQPQEAIALFLRHLWSTDGCINVSKSKAHYPRVYYGSSSEKLSRDVQSLLLRLGINARLSVSPQVNKGHDQIQVWIGGKSDLEQFINSIGAVGKYKQQSLKDIENYIEGKIENTNRDVIPKDFWKTYTIPAMQKCGITQRQMQASLGNAYCGTSLYKQNVSRERAARVAQIVSSDEIVCLANSDIYWDTINSIQYCGETDVYDLTVERLHNFIGNDIILHNSIEQDADLVINLYRDEYYNPDSPDRGIAEIIIAKHRNGPVGTVKLLFDPRYTWFENMASK